MKLVSKSLVLVVLLFTRFEMSDLMCKTLNQRRNPLNEQLIEAVKRARAHDVDRLLRLGASADAQDQDGFSALMFAALKGNAGIVKTLIFYNADVCAKAANDWTALMSAAMVGHLETVVVLLLHGACARVRSYGGHTAYDLAVYHGHQAVEAMLRSALNSGCTCASCVAQRSAKKRRFFSRLSCGHKGRVRARAQKP